jgi:hypothetical protein
MEKIKKFFTFRKVKVPLHATAPNVIESAQLR